MSFSRLILPLLAALAVVIPLSAFAQQNPARPAAPAPARPAPPAPAPARPAQPAPAPARPAPPAAAAPTVGGVQPSLLGQFGDWGAYAASPGGRKVCFALAKPASSQTVPANRPRDPAFFFISTRPAERVKDEVSIIIGYPFKPNSDATVDIGSTNFGLYTQNDGAWIKNAAEEAKMIEALRKGSDAVVKGVSGRGTQTTDTFSLKGLSQALDRVAQECR